MLSPEALPPPGMTLRFIRAAPGCVRLHRFGVVVLALSALSALSAPAAAVVFTGELRSADAEAIYAPPSSSSPVVLRYLVPEGSTVKPGDVLVRIDPGTSASQVRSLTAQIEQTHARVAKEIAELQVKEIDARIALVDAEVARDKAQVDAAVPKQFLSALDADRHAGELERATREHALKQAEQQVAEQAVQRRRSDARLEIAKLQADLDFHRAQVETAEQRAERGGIVLHGFDSWRGQRYEEGASVNVGQKIGDVVGDGGMEVRGFVIEPDRATLQVGANVGLALDALPGAVLRGRIETIAGAPEPKAEWGDGRYFHVDISFDPGPHAALLRPGMSVRIDAAAASSP